MTQKPALTPRKQPRQTRARATLEAIVQAAAQIIARDGLAGFNTNAVAQRAGVSIGSLYQYFPNKDALMVAVIQHQQQQQLTTFTAAFETVSDQSLAEVVRQLVRAAMAHHRDDAIFATAIDHEEARLPVQDLLGDDLARAGSSLKAFLAQHQIALRNLDLEAAAQTLPPMVRAIVDVWANQSPPQLQRAEDEAVRAVIGYLTSNSGGDATIERS